MMPIADFVGAFGWGYDGVNLYAPTRLYGTPDDLRRFVNRAHAEGLGVMLDVVYNHLGPDGNYLNEFSPDYFTDKYGNDWGRAINFEGPAPARALFVENAGYWIDEFHFDGLRLDATQDVHDASPQHVIASLVKRAREAGGRRRVMIVAENEPQDTRLIRPQEQGGYGVDAVWNDDFQHSAAVALTGRREAYYKDYTGSPQEFISIAKYGYVYQGQWYGWQKQARGTPALDLTGGVVRRLSGESRPGCQQRLRQAAASTVSSRTLPCADGADAARASYAVAVPGAGVRSSAPFLFFADHREDLRDAIAVGRREFLSQFSTTKDPEVQAALPPPGDPETFARCKLDLGERERHAEAYALHRDLLRLRKEDPAIAAASTRRVEGAVLSPSIFVLRYGLGSGNDRLLVVNLGVEVSLPALSEPLLAPPFGCRWILEWSSEAVRYGGSGRVSFDPTTACGFPGEAALLLRADDIPASVGGKSLATDLVRVIRSTRDAAPPDGDAAPRREWLVVNGLGGYSSGTVAGVVTRRYHGLLVAALPAPLGRVVMLNHLLERVRLPTRGVLWLGDEDEVAGPNATDRADHLVEFRLELGMPVWRYRSTATRSRSAC